MELAFDQLRADGYIQGRIGSGTYAAGLPFMPHDGRSNGTGQQINRLPRTLHMAQQLGHEVIPRDRYLRAFRPGLPETDPFPFLAWRRMISRFWKKPPSDLLYSSPPAGYQPLRVAIAEYLRIARGVICSPDQVILTSGTQNAIQLIARALINRGDLVWVEEPRYPNARYALLGAGAKLIPVPVDSGGLHVDCGKRKAKNAKMAMVTRRVSIRLAFRWIFRAGLDCWSGRMTSAPGLSRTTTTRSIVMVGHRRQVQTMKFESSK
jgi:GntR family transcriptional regulator/MocR family aminotransferase